MPAESTPLPDFANPPVVEVALAVQFEKLKGLHGAYIGILWDQLFRADYPRLEEHAPLDAVFEELGDQTRPRIQFEVMDRPPVPRSWFLDQHGTELVQIQQDRFAHNWRKTETPQVYPRYEPIRDKFLHELSVFRNFLGTEGIGVLTPNQCEVTYINHIPFGEGWSHFSELNRLASPWGGKFSDDFLKNPEDASFRVRFQIPFGHDVPTGRLHVVFNPATHRESGEPLGVLSLTARGRPSGDQLSDVETFLDQAREHVVRGFASVTTCEMHRLWGRRDAK